LGLEHDLEKRSPVFQQDHAQLKRYRGELKSPKVQRKSVARGTASVRQRLSWILLAGLLIAVLVLIVRHNEGTVGPLSSGQFASLAYKIALLVFIGAGALFLFRERLALALTAALLWVVLALILVVGYSYRFELRDVGERVMAELVPGHVITRGRTVEVARTVNGDFDVAAQINGARVAMVLDTGASSVVLTREDAKAAGLPLEVLAYTTNIETANGHARAAPVTLDRIAIGGLVEHSVAALVAQPGQLKTSLLGMSFLNRLQSWEVRGDRLLLHGYP
jgi:aspartyl protease family protein